MHKAFALVAGVALAAAAHGAVMYSWESPPDSQGAQYDSTAGGYADGTNISTFTSIGATDGLNAIQIGNDVPLGWKNLMKIFTDEIRNELSAGPKQVSIDVTVVQVAPGDIHWNQLKPILNSPTGGWDQASVPSIDIGGLGSPHTVTFTVPDQADGQGWMGIHFIWNSGINAGAVAGATADIYVDNLRISEVPEPTAMAILALAGIPLLRRRRA